MTTTRPVPPTGRSWRFARATAPIARALAGRRFFPLWAVVHHRGRTSGRAMTVPVAINATPDALVIVLPWGPGTNWARNVVAAGGATITWRGRDLQVTAPEIIGRDRAREFFSRGSWMVVEKVMGAEAFLLLRR